MFDSPSKAIAHFFGAKAHTARGRWGIFFSVAAFTLAGTFPIHGQTNVLPEFKPEAARAYWRALVNVISNQVGTNVEGYFCVARLQGQLGEKGEAERLARKALELDPGNPPIEVFLADILIRQDRMDEAAACLRDALKRDPKLKGGYRRLGMVLERLGDRRGAQDAFEAAVKTEPGDAGGWLVRGKSFLDQGRLKEAVADLEKACQLDPNTANPYYPLFQAQTKLGNRDAAQAALKKFQELKKIENKAVGVGEFTEVPEDNETQIRAFTSGAHQDAASFLLRAGNIPAAEGHLRQALRIVPQDAGAYELLSRICVQKGQLAEAKTNLEQVVRLRPNAAADRVNLGTLLLQLGDQSGGVAEFKRALELDPKRPEALHNLARFYLSTRTETPQALALAKRLVEAVPDAAGYDLLSWAYFANGKTNEALAASAEAVKHEPDSPVYSNRLRRLQQLARTRP